MKIYLAGPIFFYGDLLRNKEWAAKIRKEFPNAELYSPVENTDINGVEGKKKFAGSKEIAMADNARLDDTDILIACIDGDVLPSGTCAEIGKFHEKIKRGDNKCLIGICTDNRQCYYTHSEAKDKGGAASLGEQQYSYQNLYVTGLIKEVGSLVYTIDEVIEEMKKFYIRRITQKVSNELKTTFSTPKETITAKETLEKPKNITMNVYAMNYSCGDFNLLNSLLGKPSKISEYEYYIMGITKEGKTVSYRITEKLYNRIREIWKKKVNLGFEVTFSEKEVINEI